MLKILLYSFFVLIIFRSGSAAAQVNLNINLRHLNDMRIETFNCTPKKKDLVISLKLESFQTEQSFLRFEILEILPMKNYLVVYNDDTQKQLTNNKPFILKSVGKGKERHLFTLFIKNTDRSYCEEILDSIQLSFEPA